MEVPSFIEETLKKHPQLSREEELYHATQKCGAFEVWRKGILATKPGSDVIYKEYEKLREEGRSTAKMCRNFGSRSAPKNLDQHVEDTIGKAVEIKGKKEALLLLQKAELSVDLYRKAWNCILNYGRNIANLPALSKKLQQADFHKEKLILHNLRLVLHFVEKYDSTDYGGELWGEGLMGLVRAAEGFDPKMGCKFSYHAQFWIKRHLLKCMDANNSPVTFPIHTCSVKSKLRTLIRELEKEKGDSITLTDLEEELGDVFRKMAPVIMPRKSVEFLEETAPSEDRLGLPYEIETSPNKLDHSKDIRRALEKLSSIEKKILIMRYGLDGKGEKTLEIVGEKMGKCSERIRQIELKAIEKIRESGILEGY